MPSVYLIRVSRLFFKLNLITIRVLMILSVLIKNHVNLEDLDMKNEGEMWEIIWERVEAPCLPEHHKSSSELCPLAPRTSNRKFWTLKDGAPRLSQRNGCQFCPSLPTFSYYFQSDIPMFLSWFEHSKVYVKITKLSIIMRSWTLNP